MFMHILRYYECKLSSVFSHTLQAWGVANEDDGADIVKLILTIGRSNPGQIRSWSASVSTRKRYDLVSVNKCIMSRAKRPCVTTECKCYDLTDSPVSLI